MDTARLNRTDDIASDHPDQHVVDVLAGIETCAACGHPNDSHDTTARRFCVNLGADRRCVCSDDALSGSQHATSSHRFGYASSVAQGS
jgi:hypothetical protein